MNEQPSVSIVMATRNRPQLAAKALASIAEQTLQDLEVIVVDDGSNGDTLEQLRTLMGRFDGRFRLLTPLQAGTSGSGPSTARNRGIDKATGRFVAFLDDDDTWIWPEYLETAVGALEATGLDFFFADMEGYRGDALVWDTWRLDKKSLTSGDRLASVAADAYVIDRARVFETLRARIVHLNTLVLRRSLVQAAGPFLKWLYYAEDHEFVVRQADRIDRAVFAPQVAARYRFPEGDSTSLTLTTLDQHLQHISGAQRLRVTAQSAELKSAARRDESWHLRMASAELRRLGRRADARSLALRAFVVRPSLGNLLHVAKTVTPWA